MTDIECPICKRINDSESERCWYCQAVLKPVPDGDANSSGDWLSGLRGDSTQKPEDTKTGGEESSTSQSEEVPDWLARIRAREEVEKQNLKEQEPENISEEDNSNLPDWLKKLKNGDEEEKETPSEETPGNNQTTESNQSPVNSVEPQRISNSEDNDESEDWLTRLSEWKPQPDGEIVEQSTGDENQNQIEGFRNNKKATEIKDKTPIEIKQEPEILSEEDFSEPESTGINPGLFEDVIVHNTKSADEIENQIPQDQAETPVSETKLADQSLFEANDMKSDQDEIKEDTFPTTNPPESSFAQEEEKVVPEQKSDWLSGFQTLDTSQDIGSQVLPTNNQEQEDSIPFLTDDLPDWLSDGSVKPTADSQKSATSQEPTGSIPVSENNIEKGNLPAWLQAMRPLDSITSQSIQAATPQPINTEGLLSGIEGALTSPDISGQYKKPEKYSTSLKVSERQKNNAVLFKMLLDPSLKEESKVEEKPQNIYQLMLRLGIAILFIGLIFFAGSNAQSLTLLPNLFQSEVVSSFNLINALPADKPVLIASDFDAGLSGEAMWTSQIVIEHLMRRDISIALVSTNPVGSAIMLQQISNLNQSVPAFNPTNKMINFGYLAGGSLGIQMLGTGLKSALPYTQELLPAWSNPVVKDVTNLSDFGGVIVITDTAETARLWVEQLSPNIGSLPLIFVTTAQAAPLLQPYFESNQIAGYVSGINGSVAYEQIMQTSRAGKLHLGSYQWVILGLVFVLLIGGLVSLSRTATRDS